jgi:uncharacterized membrane protein
MISKREHFHAQIALLTAILLQIAVLLFNQNLTFGPQYLIIITELGLAVLLATAIHANNLKSRNVQKLTAGSLLGLISFANTTSLGLVLYSLIVSRSEISGVHLLASAIAIFLTNIIVYALWYWEMDSPALTSRRWTKNDKDFQFTQQDNKHEFPHWKPQFIDYLYLSVTNAINFAPADTRPVSRPAKMLMASQALVSVFTLALVIARSVSILGQ